MSKKSVKVRCSGSGLASIDEFIATQGNMKSLSKTNYAKLRGLILRQGFSFPVFVWKNGKTLRLLDGHQRVATLRKMRTEEGYDIPKIPFAEVKADSEKEAREKLLAVASQFAKVDRQGLYEFVSESDIDLGFLRENIDLPDLNLDTWAAEFYEDSQSTTTTATTTSEGLGDTRPIATCPRCHHEFPIPK